MIPGIVISASGEGCGEAARIHQDASVLHLEREDVRAAVIGARRFARFQINDPVVQRAGDGTSVHDALAEGAAFVGALVAQRKHGAVRRLEDRDVAFGRAHNARTGDQFDVGGMMRTLTLIKALKMDNGSQGVARGYDNTSVFMIGSFGVRNSALIALPVTP